MHSTRLIFERPHSRRAMLLPAALAALAALSACGGGDDAGSGGSSGGGSSTTLTFSAANPSVHNTTLDMSKALGAGNTTRAADGFSSAAYCEVFIEDAVAANGKHYGLQVYFRQSDKLPLHASVVELSASGPSPWVAFHSNSGSPITGLTVDATARTITFTNKALANAGTSHAVTVSGTLSFPRNASSTAACGA